MRITFAVAEAEIDVDVAVRPDQPVREVVTALADGPVAPQVGVLIDGRFVAPDTLVADAGLREGAVVELATGGGQDDAPTGTVELGVVGGLCGGVRQLLGPGTHLVGRHADADVVLPSTTVSARHARIHVGDDGVVTIEDLGSTNGTRVNGDFVLSIRPVAPGQIVQLGAVQLVCRPATYDDRGVVGPVGRRGVAPFNRPPRHMPPHPPAPLHVPAPPTEPSSGSRFGWAALLAPLLMGAVMAVMWDPRLALFALLTPVMMIGNWIEDRRRVKRERKRGGADFRHRLSEFKAELASARVLERARQLTLLPDPADSVQRAAGPSTRLWERRPDHEDFMRLRLGVGTVPWNPPLADGPAHHASEVDAVIADHSSLQDAPLAVDLTAGRCVGLVGDRPAVVALLRSLVCQAATHHGPTDLRIAVLTDQSRLGDWDWAKWLPHTRSVDEASGRRLLAADSSDLELVLAELASAKGTDDRTSLVRTGPAGPLTLVVADANGLTEGRNAGARELLAGGGGPVAGLVVASSVDRLPSVCTGVVQFEGHDGALTYSEPGRGVRVPGILVAGVAEAVAGGCARALAGLEDPEVSESGGNLPDVVALLDLLGMEQPSADAVLARWRGAGSIPRAVAPIGLTDRGPLVVDLVADGPHALVAGTTGSGKSELLRTLVASLAASVDPDHLNFVLIDYKGGSAFDACGRLPHTVGLVTDLDEHLGRRALRCLEAELRYRERRLREVGASDLPEYLAAGHPDPLPRLLVIIDEFAAMAAELPTFIEALVDMAQRGRSLGVHLLLATQRPTGVVNDHIRANTNLRVALRVHDTSDSADVIGANNAANIGRSQAGRGYLRLGPGELLPFQAALSTGTSASEGERRTEVRPFGFGAQPVAATTSARDDGNDRPSDLVLLVDAVRRAAETASYRPCRRPWPEALPDRLCLDEIDGSDDVDATWRAPLGIADEPELQRQRPFFWERDKGGLALYGVAGSGTTTALATLAVSLARTHTAADLHLYVLDFGNQALAPLAGLPHVGAVVGASERDRQERLIRLLQSELQRRRRLVADAGVDGVDSLMVDGRPLPAVMLMLDNYPGFRAAFDDLQGEALCEQLTRVVADGPGLGIHVVLTADRGNGIPAAVANLIPEKLVFRLADRFDYSSFGLNAKEVPKMGPGRCIDVETRQEVQVALPGGGTLADAVAAIARRQRRVDGGSLPAPIGVLPDDVELSTVLDAARIGEEERFLPVGIGDQDLAPAGFALGPGDHALVVGPARSGKSTTLATLAAIIDKMWPAASITGIALRRSPLRDSAHLSTIATDAGAAESTIAAAAQAEGPQVILVDDAELFDDERGALRELLGRRRADVHVVAAGRTDGLRSAYGHWTAEVRRSRLGFALRPQDMDGDLWNAFLPRHRPAHMNAGRGYLIVDGQTELVQGARP